VGTATAVLTAGPPWLAVATGVAVLAGSVAAHVGYVRGRVARSAAEVGKVLSRRPELGPAHGPAQTAQADPAQAGEPADPSAQTGTARASSSST
jgi:hypothetical protein